MMRAELDAAFFHLYGIERDDVDYIMETFPIVKRKDEQRYGTFRTKELILEVYDAMAEAIQTGDPYQTILDPPPGQGPRHRRSIESGGTVADGQYGTRRFLGDAGTGLREASGLPSSEMRRAGGERTQPTPYELSLDNSGWPRYWTVRSASTVGDAATVGWMSKRRRLVNHGRRHRGP